MIVTCERLIPHEEFRRDPHLTAVPFFCVDAVCEVPYGSYPGNMPGEYFSDEAHLRIWLAAERDPAGYLNFLNAHVFAAADLNAYLMTCGGLPRLRELREQEFLLTPRGPGPG